MYKYGNGRLRKCLALLALLLLSHCDESLAGSVTGVTNVRQTKFDECSARPLTIKESELQVALGFDQGTKLSPDNLQGLIQKFVTSALGNGEANSASDDSEIRRATARKCLVAAVGKKILTECQPISFYQFLDIFEAEFKSIDSTLLATNTTPKLETLPYTSGPKPAVLSVADAAAINAKQVRLLSEKGTIWHAASAFGTEAGQASWQTVRAVTSLLCARGLECPWMRGDERGTVGETPLHIALLFNAPGAALDALVADLWDLCPRLRALAYTHDLYRGENALHIAIIKRSGLPAIRRMVESPAGPALLAGRAVGTFFADPACSAGACAALGERPLAFAACTNQPAVFEYLADHGADLEAVTAAGNNLLHLLVLNAAPPPDDADGGGGEPGAVERAMMAMHGVVARRAAAAGALGRMRAARNRDGLTPLALAAAAGSRAYFEHLLGHVSPCRRQRPASRTDAPEPEAAKARSAERSGRGGGGNAEPAAARGDASPGRTPGREPGDDAFASFPTPGPAPADRRRTHPTATATPAPPSSHPTPRPPPAARRSCPSRGSTAPDSDDSDGSTH